MGVHQPIDTNAARDLLWREGHQLRSQFLDSFARLETTVRDYAKRLGLKLPENAPFSQRAKALRAVRDHFCKPKKLDERLDEIAELTSIRADIVHSVLEAVKVWDGREETSLLQFRNVATSSASARQFTLDELKKLAARAATLAHQFSQQQLKAPALAAPASASE